MFFFNWKKPKWRHKNPDVRLAAVAAIAADDTETLTSLAADTDQRVRLAAIARLNDPKLLADIACRATDAVTATEAAKKRAKILTDQLIPLPAPEALPLLASLSDDEILYDVAVLARDTKTRLAALAKVSDEVTFARIAMAPCGKEVALAASEQVTNLDLLTAIASDASSKHARAAAQSRISKQKAISEGKPQPLDPTPALTELLANAVRVQNSSSWDLAAARFSELVKTWDKHDAEHKHPLWQDFSTAWQHFNERLAKYNEKQQHAREVMEQNRIKLASCTELCCQIEEIATSGNMSDETEIYSLQKRFEEVAVTIQDDDILTLRNKIKAVLTRIEQTKNMRLAEEKRLSAMHEECRRIEILLETDSTKAELALNSLEKESDTAKFIHLSFEPFQERLKNVRNQLNERKKQESVQREAAIQDGLAARKNLCTKLEEALKLAEDAAFDQEARTVEREWKKLSPLPEDISTDIDQQYQRLQIECASRRRDQENRNEWQRWANRTRKEELCVMVESLSQETDLGLVVRAVVEAQREWKTVGPVNRDEAESLWQRFHAACEEQFTRTKPFLEEQDRERAVNLEKKIELSERVEALGEPENWQAAVETVKALQVDFNNIGPVPQGEQNEINARFRSACNAFFERRRLVLAEIDQQRALNLIEKQKIFEEAEDLSRIPAPTSAPRLRELQKRWKEVGAGPREEEQKLWERFRGLCDAFFLALDEQRRENLQKKQTLCEEAENCLTQALAADDDDLDGVAKRLKELQQEWKVIGPVPEEFKEPLWQRFRTACDSFFSRRKDFFEEQEKIRQENLSKKQALLREAEECCKNADHGAAGATLKTLQAKWKEIGLVPREAREIEQRFRQLCNDFFLEKKRIFEEQFAMRLDNQKRKEAICFQLERLLGISSSTYGEEKTSTKALTLAEELKLALESNFALAGRSTDRQSIKDEVKRLQNEWKTIGSAAREAEKTLREKFNRSLDLFYQPERSREKKENNAE